MQILDILHALRDGWRLILLTTAVCSALAVVATFLMPKQYEASTQLFVSTSSGGEEDTSQLLQGASFSQQRVKSYAEAITSPYVLDPVVEDLSLSLTAEELAERIETEIPLETVLIEVTITQGSPEAAAQVANAVSQAFIDAVPTLESDTAEASPVKVTLIRQAVPPASPVSPRPGLNVLLGLMLGFLLGAALATARHYLDTTVKSEKDVKAVSDATLVGGIHFAKDAASAPLVVHGDPHSPRAEAFRTLRTNLQFVDAAHKTRSLVVTSSIPAEGKSTTTANLALTMAEGGARVCVVEADLRRPRMVQYMGLVGDAGLTNLILGDADYEDVLQPFGDTNVTVLGAGPIPPNPSELLGSAPMQKVIRDLESSFDYVIYDAPPLLPVTDAAVLGRQVGGVLVVVGVGVVRRDQLRKTLDLLGNVGAEVLGLVLNRLPTSGEDAYTYYRDGYSSDPVEKRPAPKHASAPAKRTSALR